MNAAADRKKLIFVGIAEIAFSTDPEETLVAANLGSCLGVGVYDTKTKLAGMIHCLLPLSKSDPEKAKEKPTMYVDTGIPVLFENFFAKGSRKEDLLIWAVGCAQMSEGQEVFEIGKKNHTVFRKILWKNNLLAKHEDVGGSSSRTLSLQVGSGKAFLKTNGQTTEL